MSEIITPAERRYVCHGCLRLVATLHNPPPDGRCFVCWMAAAVEAEHERRALWGACAE